MIDYNKLKIAHELAMKYAKMHDRRLELCYEAVLNSINDSYLITLDINSGANELHKFYCIDDLITKLQELTQPEPKPKRVYYLYYLEDGETPFNRNRLSIESAYDDDLDLRYPDGIKYYPTKAELIEAQIFYWRDQLSEELEQYVSDYCTSKPHVGTANRIKEDCQHESDGIMHKMGDLDGLLPVRELGYKCIKCGEFYR